MPGRLAVDFGTSNTVVAAWDEARREGVPLHIPDFGRTYFQGGEAVSVIPSLIHYAADGRRWIGNQVLEKGLYGANTTFRWMKRYIQNRSPIRFRVDGRMISHAEAGRDFLASVLTFARQELNLDRDEEVGFSAPVEAFEHYENWLAEAAAAVSLPRFRLIDEPSAAALGYGAHIQPGDVYLIFDFGGGTLDVSVVLIEAEEQQAAGRRCRVLGKAGTDLGGMSIDQWIFQEALRQSGRRDTDEAVMAASSAVLVACERVKERLSFEEQAGLLVELPGGGAIEAGLTQAQFEELLDRHEAFTRMDRTVRRAINAALERGYGEDDIKAVLMVGGSSQIPPVQRSLRRIFGRERVMLDRPLDAIGRGAAAFVAGVDFYDHIQHDYAIRSLNRNKGDYDYQVIVPRGTAYPTPAPIRTLTVKAAQDGQSSLGLAIFEVGESRRAEGEARLELVFDATGAARLTRLDPDEEIQRARFWMNEHNPTFLAAEPPAKQGERRFEVAFSVDQNKRLVITARDLVTGRVVFQDHPVVKLT